MKMNATLMFLGCTQAVVGAQKNPGTWRGHWYQKIVTVPVGMECPTTVVRQEQYADVSFTIFRDDDQPGLNQYKAMLNQSLYCPSLCPFPGHMLLMNLYTGYAVTAALYTNCHLELLLTRF